MSIGEAALPLIEPQELLGANLLLRLTRCRVIRVRDGWVSLLPIAMTAGVKETTAPVHKLAAVDELLNDYPMSRIDLSPGSSFWQYAVTTPPDGQTYGLHVAELLSPKGRLQEEAAQTLRTMPEEMLMDIGTPRINAPVRH